MPVTFHTRESGVLTCSQQAGLITMDFPAARPKQIDAPMDLLDALGVSAVDAKHIAIGMDFILIELADEQSVLAVAPDFRKLTGVGAGCAMVTAAMPDASEYDCISRVFVPRLGIDEDPVTGSAHCVLGPYWTARLRKNELVCLQASARGGVVHVQVEGDRINLSGEAVTVMSGEILV